MKKNVGQTDKVIRVVIALILITLYFLEVVTGTWGIVMLVAAGALILTSLFSFCGLYALLRQSTSKVSQS
jgi:fatty acid desaturase